VNALRKLLRYVGIYGARRTLFKAMGRLRSGPSWLMFSGRKPQTVGIIGCGQFAFSTIGFFVTREAGVAVCYDADLAAANSFARLHAVPRVAMSAEEVLASPDVSLVYIASNHATHARYAVDALDAGKRVFVEKPVALDLAELRALRLAKQRTGRDLFAGYNRPFSAATAHLREWCDEPRGPMTFAAFVSGHRLGPDHWYRRPDEGTRICGNMGHWIDYFLHLLSWRGVPDTWRIGLVWSDAHARDDDLAISIASDHGDLASIVMTSRTEPFEGINETINVQWDDTIAKIDDFRRMTVWKGERVARHSYRPKDVGHERAILQPFAPGAREWREVEQSTLMILRLADMVRNGEASGDFRFSDAWARLGASEGQPA
jgi:predicted dehydrogenase